MSEQDAFVRIVESMTNAMIDDSHWPGVAALIDEVCGLTGNDILVAEGPKDDVRVLFVGAYTRGQRREDQEREYLENYHPTDERVPRFRQLPHGRLVHVTDLFTPDELKTSPTYNEMLLRGGGQNGMNVRLDGPDGSSIAWGLRDPVDSDGWTASRIRMVTRLLPQIRQFVRVRQALVRAEARNNTTTVALLENPRIGVVHLDRRGRILEVNDRALGILRHGDGLSDREGMLSARWPADEDRLQRVVGDALPASASPAVSGSMLLRRSPVLTPFAVHAKPVSVPQADYGARHVAALVLIAEPGNPNRVRPELVATVLGLTKVESGVAVSLAAGNSVRHIAEATGLTERAIYRHLQQIYRKHSISQQADLVRLVLLLAEPG